MPGIGALTSRGGDGVTLVGTTALLLNVLVRVFGRGVIGTPPDQVSWFLTLLALAVPLLIVVAGVIAARTTGRRSWQVLGVGLVTGGVLWFAGNWYPTAHLLLFVNHRVHQHRAVHHAVVLACRWSRCLGAAAVVVIRGCAVIRPDGRRADRSFCASRQTVVTS
jgi:MFS family permease